MYRRSTLNVSTLLCWCIIVVSCGVSTKQRLQQLPPALSPASYPKTQWLSTMEQSVTAEKNAVYASLPLAWSTLEQELGGPLRVDVQSHTLKQLAHTAVDHSSLNKNQFQSAVYREDDRVALTASLDAHLHFDPAFEHLPYKIKFEGVPVHTFGMSENSFEYLHNQIEIHRYRDDNHFIIGLLPTDRQQQILLYKTDKKYATLAAMYVDFQEEIQHGRADMTVPERAWRYRWDPLDQVAIPRVSLGAKGEYPQLAGSVLYDDQKRVTLEKVQQTVAFMLNETGTKLSSERDMMIDLSGPPRGGPIKNCILDDSFYIIVKKREENSYPYLILWINNTELLDIS